MTAGVFLFARVLDKRGRPLSVGHNSFVKTDPNFSRLAEDMGYIGKKFIHAEAMAIKRLPRNKKGTTIQVFRFYKNGQPAMAKPCPVCQKMIEDAGIKIIEYTEKGNPLGMKFEEYRGLRESVKWWDGPDRWADEPEPEEL